MIYTHVVINIHTHTHTRVRINDLRLNMIKKLNRKPNIKYISSNLKTRFLKIYICTHSHKYIILGLIFLVEIEYD